jgi:hypothetical protein
MGSYANCLGKTSIRNVIRERKLREKLCHNVEERNVIRERKLREKMMS